jgi:ubiquinone/menaquinone biosynthesis C-methylase UbiE
MRRKEISISPDYFTRRSGDWQTRDRDVAARSPRLTMGRAQAILLPDNSLDKIIVERTPLQMAALREIQRVIHDEGTISSAAGAVQQTVKKQSAH